MHIALLKACLFNYVNVKHVKPSCNFNFWCLEWLMNLNYKVSLEIFWKFEFWKKNLQKKCVKKIKNMKFLQIFWGKSYILIQNMNLKCFQLSFDVHIVTVSQKLQFFYKCCKKCSGIIAVKEHYFYTTFWEKICNIKL